jgi:phage terminase Nu1 subunit (DNA packaging protein)
MSRGGFSRVLLLFWGKIDCIADMDDKNMSNADIVVTPDVLAKFLRVNTSRVHQLAREGTIPKPKSGRANWDLMACVHAYWDYKEQAGGKPESKDAEYWNEKTRLTKAQADKEELMVSEKKGELVDAVEIIQEYSNYVLACRAKLLSMPTKLAYELIEINNPNIIQNKLEQAIDEALLELASEEFISSSISETNPEDSQ